MEEKSRARAGHSVTIDGRKSLVATGVLDVGTVTQEGVVAATELGELHIRGKDLKVVRLDAATGELTLSGEVQALSYAQAQTARSWLARLLK